MGKIIYRRLCSCFDIGYKDLHSGSELLIQLEKLDQLLTTMSTLQAIELMILMIQKPQFGSFSGCSQDHPDTQCHLRANNLQGTQLWSVVA